MSKPHRRRRRPSAAFIISCLALFMAMGGVSYGFAAGSIDSKEIKNNDLRGKDVRQHTLTGDDVKGNSLGGGAVKESSLGKVPQAASADNAATVGGVGPDALTIGRGTPANDCAPGGAPIKCATLTLDVPRPGRVLVMTGGQWHSDEVTGTSVRGFCQILHNNVELAPPTQEGTISDATDSNQEAALATQPVVTDVLQPGSHEFALAAMTRSVIWTSPTPASPPFCSARVEHQSLPQGQAHNERGPARHGAPRLSTAASRP